MFALTAHKAKRDLDIFLLVHQHLSPCRKHSPEDCPHVVAKFDVAACLPGLTLQGISLPVDLSENIVYARKIEPGCFKTRFGKLPFCFEFCDTGSFLDQ